MRENDLADPESSSPLPESGLYRHVGRQIGAWRHRRGLSRENLAYEVGVSSQQMYNYERGRTRMSASRLVMIAIALDIDVESLLPLFQSSPPNEAWSLDNLLGAYRLLPDLQRTMLDRMMILMVERGGEAGGPRREELPLQEAFHEDTRKAA